jgi:hypothetical protein
MGRGYGTGKKLLDPRLKPKGSIYQRRAVIKRDPLDALFSQVIRTRDPRCRLGFLCHGAARTVEAAHVFKRTYKSIRWDEDNCFGACWACHHWAEEHQTELHEWARKTLGATRFNRLLIRKTLTMREAGVEPLVEREKLRRRLKQLKSDRTAD